MFRWDKILEGAVISGILAVTLAAPPLFTDGKVTGPEAVMIAGAFIAGIGLYLRNHKSEWDGTERRSQPPEPGK